MSQRAETNMQLAFYTVRHHNRVSWVTNVGAMNLNLIRHLRELKIKEDARTSDPPAVPKIDAKNWLRSMDAIQDYFTCVLGETKAPLAYVIRDEAAVTAKADDRPDNYHTSEDEMVARMPHQDANGDNLPTYIYDRSKVWQTMS